LHKCIHEFEAELEERTISYLFSVIGVIEARHLDFDVKFELAARAINHKVQFYKSSDQIINLILSTSFPQPLSAQPSFSPLAKMPTPRLPAKVDFPSSLTLDIIPPSSGQPVNVLILLHGLGDTNKSFTSLGKNLNLPETACISLQGPNPIPPIFTGSDAPAFHWGDDVLFDERKGEIELDAGFNTASKILLESVVKEVLIGKCGYPARNILFLGFGQGGMAALQAVAKAGEEEAEFGGVVSIGGRLPASFSESAKGKSKTPILVLAGSRSSEITRSAVDGLKERFGEVEYVKWVKGDDSMPRNREEMLPIMKFFARRLRSRAGVPEEAVEV
jgi:predicted esterase